MTRLAKWALFATAYAPLTGLIWIRLLAIWLPAAVAAIAITVLLLLIGALVFRLLSRGTEADVTIVTAERMSDTAPNFLLGYILPFLLLDLKDSSAVITGVCFVGILGWAYVRGGMLYANPLLTLAGFHVWRTTAVQTPGTGKTLSLVLITKLRELNERDTIRTSGDEDGIRLARPKGDR